MTASWLLQMGWDAVVLDAPFAALATGKGPVRPASLGLAWPAPDAFGPGDLQDLLAGGDTVLVDLANSREYRRRHIPTAWFGIRSRLGVDLGKLPRAGRLVFTSEDGALAQVACADEFPGAFQRVAYLQGGTQAWVEAGLPVAAGEERMASPPEDIWLRPYERKGDVSGAMAEYLDWEVNLLAMIDRDGTTAFKAY
jgi:rhodanese-related sulfurtransferase